MSQPNFDEFYNKLESMFEDKIRTMKADITEKIKEDIAELLDNKIGVLTSEVSNLKCVVEQQTDKIRELERKNLNLDTDLRKKNILMFNVAEDNSKSIEDTVLHTINANAGLNITSAELDTAYRLGKVSTEKIRPILVKFTAQKSRDIILTNIPKFAKNKISVYEDLPKEIADFRKKVYPLVKKLRREGKRIFYTLDEFRVNGLKWTAEEVEAALKGISEGSRKRERSPDDAGSNPTGNKGAVKKFISGGFLATSSSREAAPPSTSSPRSSA